ncbi:transmembrane protein 132C [Anguilla anguilla]|uniref:transmembrane protein 132C n=1 Tax=Anguilla anguilla TaxID=7936 RepID=UPI0015AD6EE9|nr:transmembrane protein 132C [Anguilla anguilla]
MRTARSVCLPTPQRTENLTDCEACVRWRFPRMCAILTATILAVFVQGLDGAERGEGVKALPLPVSFRVLNAEALFLKEASGDLLPNSSLASHTQALVLLRAGQSPAITAGYGPLSAQAPAPPGLVQGPAPGRRLRPFILARRVLSSSPKVRVLFHAAGGRDVEGGAGGEAAEGEEEQTCVTVYGFSETQEARGACTLAGDSGFCVAELEPPLAWFRPPGGASSRERQDQKEAAAGAGTLELYYRPRPLGSQGRCVPEDSRVGGAEGGHAPTATPMRRIGSVRLHKVPPGTAPLSRLRLGGGVVVQTSSNPVKSTEVATFIVCVSSASPLSRFTLRATVKKGLSFSTARPRNPHLWDTTLEPGTGAQLGTISVICQRKSPVPGKRPEGGLLELLLLDFETEELSSLSEMREVTWQLELPGGQRRGEEGVMGIYTMLKDYVGLAPVVMDTELVNTAVLTGKKVSIAVKTVAVAADGSVTDVSNFTQCRSTDEDVLKVSDRCDYVFVNGKESKGRVRVAVNFTLGPLSAQLEMSVWMPRLPLQVEVSDPELSQIKGWRVPVPAGRRSSGESEEEEERRGRGCMLQFQHAQVKVFASFLAEQPDRRLAPAHFLGPGWRADVTRLVRPSLRVENPRVARLQAGRVLLGRGAGVTSVKVLSPLSDSVLGERSVKVLDDRVSITELGVQLVSGLSLSLQLSPGSNRAIVATATTQEVLHSPKQEAVIGCWVQFSDGAQVPLDMFEPSSYTLTVSSLDRRVVSMRGSPAVAVAEGEGQGALVRVEMGISEACQKSKRKSSLAVAHGGLRVAFRPGGPRGGDGREAATEPGGRSLTEETSVFGSEDWRPSSTEPSLLPDPASVSLGGARSTTVRAANGVGGVSSTVGGASTGVGGVKRTGGGANGSVQGAGSNLGGASNGVGGAGSSVGGASQTGGRASNDVGGASQTGGRASNDVGGASQTGGGASSSVGGARGVLGGVSSPVYDGGAVSVGGARANTLDYSDLPSQVEVPRWTPAAEVETDVVQASRFPSSLEIGMYALLGVLCLAILVFLLNCVSYLTGSRHKKPPPAHCQDAGGHRHNWVWLGTEADRALSGPVTPPPPETHAAIAISIDVPPGAGLVAMGRSATLGRRPGGPPAAEDPPLGRRGSLQARPARPDSSLHSPTSKRKRVQFTTFSSLDGPHYCTLPGMHWASRVQEFASQQGALPEALYANLSYEHKPTP